MKRTLCFLGAIGIAAGCSTSSTSTPNDSGTGGGDTGSHAETGTGGKNIAAADNCVKPGYMGNELGVGAFCDDTASCPTGKTLLICTGFQTGVPTNEYFCTALCTEDKDCGTGAYCHHDPRGSACLPAQCGGTPNDAGTDSGPGVDASDASEGGDLDAGDSGG
jgi:hypothetical protein